MEQGDHSELETNHMLSSSFEEISDEEISTKKERHWRLGPEDLNETLLYDFPGLDRALFLVELSTSEDLQNLEKRSSDA